LTVGLLALPGVSGAADPKPKYGNVSYGDHANQVMDLYLPPAGTGPFPVLLWFGGIWKPGKHPVQVTTLGKAQIAVIAVQTRTMNDALKAKIHPPISVVCTDACRAVQFVRMHAAKYKLDRGRIAVGGGSQGAFPALYVGLAGERAEPGATDPVERVSTKVVCVAAYRAQPTIDPQRMQEWVPGVEWGAPALGYTFKDSLKRRKELVRLLERWSPDYLIHKDMPPVYFENNWGLTRPKNVTEADYKVHSPAWALGFQQLTDRAGVVCHVKYPGHPTENYNDIWEFIVKELKAAAK
jgi:acetyl esterase/lipase